MKFKTTRIVSIIIFIIISLSLPAAYAQNLNEELDQLGNKFGVNKIPSDYVIVLDTSGSMKDIFPSVQQSLADFINALSEGDYVSIILFDTYPRLVFSDSLKNPSIKQQAINRIMGEKPTGQFTDIGSAIESALSEINRPIHNEIQNLIFLTDGLHDPPPPPQSKYQAKSGSLWDDLEKQAASSNSFLRVYGLGLKENTDIALLKQVFSQTSILALPPNQLSGYFERLKKEVILNKIRSRLEPELKNGNLVVLPLNKKKNWGQIKTNGSISQKIVIKSNYKVLPVRINLDEANLFLKKDKQYKKIVRPLAASLEPPKLNLILQPGESTKPINIKITSAFNPNFVLGEKKQGYEGYISLIINASVMPNDAIGRLLRLDPKANENARIPLEFTYIYGITWQTIIFWLIELLLIILIIFTLARFLIWLIRAKPKGILEIYDSNQNLISEYNLAKFLRRKINIGKKQPINVSDSEHKVIGWITGRRGRDDENEKTTFAVLHFLERTNGKVDVISQDLLNGDLVNIGQYEIRYKTYD